MYIASLLIFIAKFLGGVVSKAILSKTDSAILPAVSFTLRKTFLTPSPKDISNGRVGLNDTQLDHSVLSVENDIFETPEPVSSADKVRDIEVDRV